MKVCVSCMWVCVCVHAFAIVDACAERVKTFRYFAFAAEHWQSV